MRIALREIIEADEFQHFPDARGFLGVSEPAQRAAPPGAVTVGQAEGDVLGDAEMGEEGEVLRDHADAALFGRSPDSGSDRCLAVDLDQTPVGALEAGEDAQRRGLAAAAGTEQRQNFTVPDLE